MGINKIAYRHMNVEIGNVAAQFLGIFVSNFLYWFLAVRVQLMTGAGSR
jgi:hypothetical protein